MSKKIKVITGANLRMKLPVLTTVVAWLVMDKLHPSDIVWGIVGTLFVFYWVIAIWRRTLEEYVDIFKDR